MAVLTVLLAVSLASVQHGHMVAWAADGPKDLCDSQVYCKGPLLETVQLSGIFEDSKTFVDLSQLYDPNVTLDNFNTLMKNTGNEPNRDQIKTFVWENFNMEDELENATLPDWKENPAILRTIKDPNYREWAKELNNIWRKLARKISKNVIINPQQHSLIPVNNTFIIPGGRFKEFYYWDSYWIIEGMLLCDMKLTVKGMLENFLSMVEKYGFVPNGGRIYYLSRSQPPLLIPMVTKYYEFTHDLEFVRKNLALLETEFEYWLNEKTVEVKKNGKTYRMAHYVVNSPRPRPESYKEDYQLAQKVPGKERGALYNNLKAAAESGWDFSYRWCVVTNENANLSLVNVSTSNIIPVDLNAILERNARSLVYLFNILGYPEKVQNYTKIANHFQNGIDNVLWNEKEGVWLDYDVGNQRSRNAFYPSNLTPLYTMSYDKLDAKKNDYARKAINYLTRNNIQSYFGGTPTSANYTGEQWDFPNAWPPLQSVLVKGLHQTKVREAMDLAKELASRWLRSNYIGYDENHIMYEKYDAQNPGKSGGGGEYIAQEGFGWTNGVTFEFLNLYPDAKSSDVSEANR